MNVDSKEQYVTKIDSLAKEFRRKCCEFDISISILDSIALANVAYAHINPLVMQSKSDYEDGNPNHVIMQTAVKQSIK